MGNGLKIWCTIYNNLCSWKLLCKAKRLKINVFIWYILKNCLHLWHTRTFSLKVRSNRNGAGDGSGSENNWSQYVLMRVRAPHVVAKLLPQDHFSLQTPLRYSDVNFQLRTHIDILFIIIIYTWRNCIIIFYGIYFIICIEIRIRYYTIIIPRS